MAALCWSCCGVDTSVDSSSWKIRNEQKLTWKVLETSNLPQFEKTSLKSEKKYKNHKQAEYHHTLKRNKNSVKCRAMDSNLGPLVYEASVLPTELPSEWKTERKQWQYIFDLLFNKCRLVWHTPSTLFNTHYHTLLNTASWTVWPPPTTLYDQLWRHVRPTMFVNLTPALAFHELLQTLVCISCYFSIFFCNYI